MNKGGKGSQLMGGEGRENSRGGGDNGKSSLRKKKRVEPEKAAKGKNNLTERGVREQRDQCLLKGMKAKTRKNVHQKNFVIRENDRQEKILVFLLKKKWRKGEGRAHEKVFRLEGKNKAAAKGGEKKFSSSGGKGEARGKREMSLAQKETGSDIRKVV